MKQLAFAALLIASSAACAPKDAAEAPKPAKGTEIPLVNAGFEDPMQGHEIPGWTAMQHGGEPAYEILADTRRPFSGKQSARITRTKEEHYGLIRQRLKAPAVGQIVEFTAALRTDEVGPLGWRMFIHFEDGSFVVSDVASTPMTGTRKKWQRVTIRGAVPQYARALSIGVELLDAGTGWIDEVGVRVVDAEPAKDAAPADAKAGAAPKPQA